MNTTIEYSHYSITLSLNENKIYLKTTDKINYLQYETDVEPSELRLPFDLTEIYKLMENAIRQHLNFFLDISVQSGSLLMKFRAILSGIVNIKFDIILPEKHVSNDGQITVQLNRIEQTLLKRCEELEERCNQLEERLGCSEIKLGYLGDGQGEFFPVKVEQLQINFSQGLLIQFHKIHKFYKLKVLKLWVQSLTESDLNQIVEIKNTNLNMLIFTGVLTLSNKFLCNLMNFPNLEYLSFTGSKDIFDILELIKNSHKLKAINVFNCPKLQQNLVLQNYCQRKNIKMIQDELNYTDLTALYNHFICRSQV